MDFFQSILKESSVLYSNREIHLAIKKIAEEINRDIQSDVLYVLTVMNGGLYFSAHLIPLLKHTIYHDYIHATRYGNKAHGGLLHWIKEPEDTIEGKNILIIDDILDEGITLSEIISKCKKMGANNIFYTALFNKLTDKEKSILPGYHVLNVPNKFVFGFGLDYKGFGRALPDLHIIN
jgi:hypoxanthine phosphoribosyltransferase